VSISGIYDLIIVGGGPGGLTAGVDALRTVLKTVLIEKGFLIAPPATAFASGIRPWRWQAVISQASFLMKRRL